MKKFNFNDVRIAFDFRSIPSCDRYYLKQMIFNTVKSKSYNDSKKSFANIFPDAGNFTLINDTEKLDAFKRMYQDHKIVTSHELTNRSKYYFAWSY